MRNDGAGISWSDMISPDDSLIRLLNMLSQVESEYQRLSNSVINSSAQMQRAMQNLSNAQTQALNVTGLTRQAQDVKAVMAEMQNMIKAVSEAKAAVSNVTTDMLGDSNSVNTLTKALKDNIKAFQDLALSEKTAETEMRDGISVNSQYLDRITSLRTQISLTNRALKSFSTELGEVEAGGKRYNATLLKLEESERKYLQQVKAREEASKRALKMEELEAKEAAAVAGSYEQMSIQYQKMILLLKQMTKEEYEQAKAEGGLISQARALQAELRQRDEAVGNYTRNVGHYQKVWSGFDYSVAQIMRELPNVAISVRTFIMALSNNIATVGDEIKVFLMAQQAELGRTLTMYEKVTLTVKRLGKALVSWNTILMIGVTVFTKYGEAWGKAIYNWITGRDELQGLNKAMVETNDLFKKGSTELSNNLTELYKLKREWQELKNDAQGQVDWINKNTDAFEKMGLSIKTTAEAEMVLVKNTEMVIGAMMKRAKAEAALQNVKDKTDKATQAQLDKEAEIAKATGQVPGFLSKTWYGMKRIFTAGEYLSGKEAFEELSRTERDKIYFALKDLARPWAAEEGITEGPEYVVDQNKFKQLLDVSTGFNIIVKDYINAVKEGDAEINKARNNLDDAVELQNKLAKEAVDEVRKQRRMQIELEHGRDFADAITDEYVDWIFNLRKSAKTDQKLKVTNLDESLFPEAKFLFSDLSKKSGGGRKGPEGMDLEKWLLENQEKYRHKNALAEAKQDEDDWERKIKLIDERYEHERFEIKKIRDFAQKILDGKVKIKGDITPAQRAAVKSLVDQYSGIMSELTKANIQEQQDVIDTRMLKELEHEKSLINLRLQGVEKESDAERSLQQQRLEMEKQIAIIRNRKLPASERMLDSDILSAYGMKQKELTYQHRKKIFTDLSTRYSTQRATEKQGRLNVRQMFGFNRRQQSIFDLETQMGEMARQREALLMEYGNSQDTEKRKSIWADMENLATKEEDIKNKLSDLQGVKGLLGSISERGLLGGILDMTGMKDDTAKAVGSSFDIIKDNISSLIDSYVKLAEAAVKAQEQQVSAAQKVVDAELEASKQGYANRVASAQEDLKLEKQKLKEQKKEREKALKAQRAMDSAEAASSLTVAIAQLWKSCIQTEGFFGVPIATALTAVMLGSFVASRVKATKAARMQDEEYGEGGLEFLEGGSHASGNDINLHTRNSEGRNMRAEGGEAMAIINKRNTRKYKGILPDVIDSLNKGVFEDKYLNAFSQGAQLHAQILAMPTYQQTDLSGLESKLDKLVKQGENKVVSLPNGNTIEYFGNVKRTIKKND